VDWTLNFLIICCGQNVIFSVEIMLHKDSLEQLMSPSLGLVLLYEEKLMSPSLGLVSPLRREDLHVDWDCFLFFLLKLF
jgi:hypothetical protein